MPVSLSTPPLLSVEKLVAYQREFHALRERLRVAEHRTLQRSSELNAILEQFRHAIAETNGSKDALSNFSGKATHTPQLLKELAHRKPLQVPNIYHHLPHLLNNEGSLHPAVQVGQGRTGGEPNNVLFISILSYHSRSLSNI
uniref:Uncharacterized protein n=1 Tax=Sinocyclocheilus anshuiensis TaxID=1608454 RepID=A0A671KH97_9TELE